MRQDDSWGLLAWRSGSLFPEAKNFESKIRTIRQVLLSIFRKGRLHDPNGLDGCNKITLEVVECLPTPKSTLQKITS
jgi:hypothetical protein